MVRVRVWTVRGSGLAEALILASLVRPTFKGPNGSGAADRWRKSFSALESFWGHLPRRKVFEASCGVYRLEMYRSGDVDGVRYAAVASVPRPLGLRGPSSSVTEVDGLKVNNGTGVRGNGEASRSSLVPLFVNGVRGASQLEAGVDGYEPPPLPKP